MEQRSDQASVTAALAICIQAGQVPKLEGAPGGGKTEVNRAIARSLGYPIVTVMGSLYEPQDILGLPKLTDRGVEYISLKWARDVKRLADEYERVIVFFDEITTVVPAVQKAMLRVLWERVVGELQLPDNVSFSTACNPPELAADGQLLAPPLANRLVHFLWPKNPRAWCDGMLAGWPDPHVPRVPANWMETLPKAVASVSSFIHARQTLLEVIPKDESGLSYAYPTGRTWDIAMRLIAAAQAAGADDEIESLLIAGAVGDAAAMEFINWRRELDLPDPEALLANPDSLVLPERGDRVFAILASVTAAVLSKNTAKRWAQGWQVLSRAGKKAPDIAASSARSLAMNRPKDGAVPKEAAIFYPLLKAAGLANAAA